MVDHGHAHEGPRYFKEPMGDQNLSLCTKTTRTVLTGWMQPRGSQRAHHIGHTWLTIKHKGGDHRRTISYTIIAIIAHWIHRLPALFYLNSFFLFAKQLDPNLFSLCLLAFFLAYSVAVEIWWFCPLKEIATRPKNHLAVCNSFALPSPPNSAVGVQRTASKQKTVASTCGSWKKPSLWYRKGGCQWVAVCPS